MPISTLIQISRPRFWVYLAGPYLLGFLFAGGDLFAPDFLSIVNFFYFLFIANVYLYGVNDLFDRDTDALNPKKQDKEHLLQTNEVESLKGVLIFCFLLSLILIWIQPTPVVQGLFAIYLFLATFYSVPPLRFKSSPLVDSFSNVLYAFPGFIAYASLTGELISWPVFVLALCWTAAMHLYSAIPDIKADMQANLNTTAILVGEKGSLIFCAILWSIFAVLFIVTSWGYPYSLLSLVYPVLPVWVLFAKKDIEQVYWFFPYLNAGMGFVAFLLFFV